MKSLNNKFSSLDLQFIAHWVYIVLSIHLYQSYTPLMNLAVAYLLVFLLIYTGKKYTQGRYFNHTYLTVFAVCNSTYLNALYDYHYFLVFPLTVLLGVSIKLFFRRNIQKRSMLNPSLTAIFLASMFFPQYVTYGPNLWSSEWWQIITVLVIGSYVTYRARTLVLSYSYIGSYILSSIIIGVILKINIFSSTMPVASPLSWILGILSFGKLIFIFHVISDPLSGPITTKGKIIFGASIAFIEVLMKYFGILNSVAISYMLVLTLLHVVEDFIERKQAKLEPALAVS